MYSTFANEYTAILTELIRLNGGGTVPVFTTEGEALQRISNEAYKLKNGAYGTFPLFTSRGQMLDDIATLLSAANPGGEVPVTTVLNVPSQVTNVSGSPTGTVTCKKYSNRMEYLINVTGPATWFFDIPYGTNILRPKDDGYFEHDIANAGAFVYNSGPGGTAIRFSTGNNTVFTRNVTLIYAT
jgi:hypothetical protein